MLEVITKVMVSPNPTLWVSVPELPLKVKMTVEVGAEAFAERVICCAVPGVKVMAEGETVTPVGTPLTCTVTCEEKPFEPVAESESVAELPV